MEKALCSMQTTRVAVAAVAIAVVIAAFVPADVAAVGSQLQAAA